MVAMGSEKTRVTIGLSKQKRLPSLKFLGCSYAPWKFASVVRASREWNIQETRRGEFSVSRFGKVLTLPRDNLGVLLGEWEEWKKTYLPSFALTGKVVLDVGAGAGETALLFFIHGARKVIAVECNEHAIRLLRLNATKNNWDLEVVPGSFKPEHLQLGVDFLKMDCEGCEELLSHMGSLPPCRIEVHSTKARKMLETQFGLKVLRYGFSQDIVSIMGN